MNISNLIKSNLVSSVKNTIRPMNLIKFKGECDTFEKITSYPTENIAKAVKEIKEKIKQNSEIDKQLAKLYEQKEYLELKAENPQEKLNVIIEECGGEPEEIIEEINLEIDTQRQMQKRLFGDTNGRLDEATSERAKKIIMLLRKKNEVEKLRQKISRYKELEKKYKDIDISDIESQIESLKEKRFEEVYTTTIPNIVIKRSFQMYDSMSSQGDTPHYKMKLEDGCLIILDVANKGTGEIKRAKKEKKQVEQEINSEFEVQFGAKKQVEFLDVGFLSVKRLIELGYGNLEQIERVLMSKLHNSIDIDTKIDAKTLMDLKAKLEVCRKQSGRCFDIKGLAKKLKVSEEVIMELVKTGKFKPSEEYLFDEDKGKVLINLGESNNQKCVLEILSQKFKS